MSKLLLILTFLAVQISANDVRIVGGYLAKEGEFPYQVSICRSYNNQHFCGGSIITSKHVLTAAHCMFYPWGGLLPPFLISVVVGQLNIDVLPNSTYRNASEITVHPGYNQTTGANDIAIVELNEPLLQNNLIRIVPLNTNFSLNNTSCIVSGWGVLKYGSSSLSNNLRATDVNILDFRECQNRYRMNNVTLHQGMLCAVNDGRKSDACQGDSGGPLVCEGHLAGVVSTGNDCGDPQFPGIYSDVAYFLPWIKSVVDFDENSKVDTTSAYTTTTTEETSVNVNLITTAQKPFYYFIAFITNSSVAVKLASYLLFFMFLNFLKFCTYSIRMILL